MNLHGRPIEPKSIAYTSFATSAYEPPGASRLVVILEDHSQEIKGNRKNSPCGDSTEILHVCTAPENQVSCFFSGSFSCRVRSFLSDRSFFLALALSRSSRKTARVFWSLGNNWRSSAIAIATVTIFSGETGSHRKVRYPPATTIIQCIFSQVPSANIT